VTELVPHTAHGLASAGERAWRRTALLGAAWLAGYSGRTREAYERDLQAWGRWCAEHGVEVLDARRPHVQLYARQLEEAGRAPATVARKLSVLAGFYAYAVAEGELERSPVAHVRRPRVPDDSPRLGLTRGELLRLLAAAAAHSPAAHALICLLALNGLRVSEACGVAAGDVSEMRGHQVITVVRKGGKRANVPLAPRTATAVTTLLGTRSPAADAVTTLLGLDRYAAWRLVRDLAAAAGITKRISPHSLRHTFVTLALDAGVALRDVQDAAGHTDPRTTRRYDRGRQSLDRHATYAVAAFLVDDAGG
jgi:site-specific recombinase XerD